MSSKAALAKKAAAKASAAAAAAAAPPAAPAAGPPHRNQQAFRAAEAAIANGGRPSMASVPEWLERRAAAGIVGGVVPTECVCREHMVSAATGRAPELSASESKFSLENAHRDVTSSPLYPRAFSLGLLKGVSCALDQLAVNFPDEVSAALRRDLMFELDVKAVLSGRLGELAANVRQLFVWHYWGGTLSVMWGAPHNERAPMAPCGDYFEDQAGAAPPASAHLKVPVTTDLTPCPECIGCAARYGGCFDLYIFIHGTRRLSRCAAQGGPVTALEVTFLDGARARQSVAEGRLSAEELTNLITYCDALAGLEARASGIRMELAVETARGCCVNAHFKDSTANTASLLGVLHAQAAYYVPSRAQAACVAGSPHSQLNLLRASLLPFDLDILAWAAQDFRDGPACALPTSTWVAAMGAAGTGRRSVAEGGEVPYIRASHWQQAGGEGSAGGGGGGSGSSSSSGAAAAASAAAASESGSNVSRYQLIAAASEERPLRTCMGGAPRPKPTLSPTSASQRSSSSSSSARPPPPFLAPHLTRCIRACVETLAIARVLERLRRKEVTFRTAELFEGIYAECGHRMRVPTLWPNCKLPAGEVEEMLHRQLPSLMTNKGRERQVPGEALWAFPGLDKAAGGGKGGGAAAAISAGPGSGSGSGGSSGTVPTSAGGAFSDAGAAAAAMAAFSAGGRLDGASESGLNLALISAYAASSTLMCGTSLANPNVLLWAPALATAEEAAAAAAAASGGSGGGSGSSSSSKRAGILVYCRAASAPPVHATAQWVSAAFQWFRTLAVTHEFCDPVRRKASLVDAAVLRRLLHPADCSSAAAVGGVWGDWGMRSGGAVASAGEVGGAGAGAAAAARFRPLPPSPACIVCSSREGQVGADGKLVQLSVCGGCGGVAFCGLLCQRSYWLEKHMHECGGSKGAAQPQLMGEVQ